MDFWVAYNCKCERARKSSQDGQKINAIWIVDHSMFKLTLPIQVARPILTNNSIEQHCFVVMNVKLLVRTIIYCFRLEQNYQHRLLCSEFSHILARSAKFTERNWVSKTLYSLINIIPSCKGIPFHRGTFLNNSKKSWNFETLHETLT